MKKLFTLLLISIFAINTTCAQVEGEGTWILGATTELSNAPWSQIAMQPTIGYFISDNMAVGLGFGYGSTKNETQLTGFNNNGDQVDYTETNTTSNISMTPWMRLYMGDMFFVNAAVTIGSGSDKDETSNSELSGWTDSDGSIVGEMTDKSSSFGLNIGGGASILWGDHIAFEPMFGFTMGSSSETPFDQDKEKGPSTMGLGFSIGVCVMLGN